MLSPSAKPTPKRRLISALALSAVAAAMFASSANAEIVTYSGTNLPGHTWTIGHGVLQPRLFRIEAYANTTSSVCAGAVTHDGAGFHTPYGWTCSPSSAVQALGAWYGVEVSGYAGVYNPNPGTFQHFEGIGTGV
jgi:hypothetical protein